ncbi:MAG: hypothetical protein M1368_03465 [Thaumarchaeota archaeon]|nr:hypothetical protein [Nitrososphaerota archaeon]
MVTYDKEAKIYSLLPAGKRFLKFYAQITELLKEIP